MGKEKNKSQSDDHHGRFQQEKQEIVSWESCERSAVTIFGDSSNIALAIAPRRTTVWERYCAATMLQCGGQRSLGHTTAVNFDVRLLHYRQCKLFCYFLKLSIAMRSEYVLLGTSIRRCSTPRFRRYQQQAQRKESTTLLLAGSL